MSNPLPLPEPSFDPSMVLNVKLKKAGEAPPTVAKPSTAPKTASPKTAPATVKKQAPPPISPKVGRASGLPPPPPPPPPAEGVCVHACVRVCLSCNVMPLPFSPQRPYLHHPHPHPLELHHHYPIQLPHLHLLLGPRPHHLPVGPLLHLPLPLPHLVQLHPEPGEVTNGQIVINVNAAVVLK